MKRYELSVVRRWIVGAPDDFNEDAVFNQSVDEFLDVDLRDYVEVQFLPDEPAVDDGGADLVLEPVAV